MPDLERLAKRVRIKNNADAVMATTVRKPDREAARIFPRQPMPPLQLSGSRLAQLALFCSNATWAH